MIAQEKINALKSAKVSYMEAVTRKSGVSVAKERMMNLLFTYFDDLMSLVKECEELQEEISALEAALTESEEEVKHLRETAEEKKVKKKSQGGA